VPLHLGSRLHAFLGGLGSPGESAQTDALYREVEGLFSAHQLLFDDGRAKLVHVLTDSVLCPRPFLPPSWSRQVCWPQPKPSLTTTSSSPLVAILLIPPPSPVRRNIPAKQKPPIPRTCFTHIWAARLDQRSLTKPLPLQFPTKPALSTIISLQALATAKPRCCNT